MGHAVEYFTTDKRSKIMAVAEEYAFYNTDRGENPAGSYHGRMTIHDKPICESYDDAVRFIEAHDNGWYDDHAVQFKDKSALAPTKAMLANKERAKKLMDDKKAYEEKHDLRARKSEYIGCKTCGSKLSLKHLRGNKCPLCGTDLRADYVIERLVKYTADYQKLLKQYTEMENKQNGKCPIKWLVKVEVHC